ncbi:hypothetical protein L249_6668 [Ophiocordyceps polyrhachis-furcata BCC 54312]|uniref:OPT family small oligopeptide transporter n=1 Tax=Ophiocordyceps polyrhachis-furcata BCC 54312 TaxID=1330021 RepID=A0A367LJC8_9HYPO|nr:hypothetical protein L249_6668 [Ophiocordyceps polyrhachis-furcata BCC 54312]
MAQQEQNQGGHDEDKKPESGAGKTSKVDDNEKEKPESEEENTMTTIDDDEKTEEHKSIITIDDDKLERQLTATEKTLIMEYGNDNSAFAGDMETQMFMSSSFMTSTYNEKELAESLSIFDEKTATECGSTVAYRKSVESLSKDHLTSQLEKLLEKHELDQNFPSDLLARARTFLRRRRDGRQTGAEDMAEDMAEGQKLMDDFRAYSELVRNSSPYMEVRSVVDITDDPSTPVGTFRVFLLGTLFSVAGSAMHQFFSLRLPSISISVFVVQLLTMPLGVAMARWLPEKREVGRGRFTFDLNPGPFSKKEHILIAMMANVAFGSPYVVSIVQVLKLDMFYGEKVLSNSLAWQVLTLVSTQLIGYGCAGLTRRFLVYPPSMIWPGTLATIALTRALRRDSGPPSKGDSPWGIMTMSRYRFFIVSFAAMFVWFWIPNYLFKGLSLFNWPTWVAPGSVTLAILAGSTCGLGLINPLPTLDWNIVTTLGDPIVTPLFTLLNFAAGFAIAGFIMAPIMYFANVLNTGYLPINDNKVYNNSGQFYEVTKVLNPDLTLNEEAYRAYSVPYLSATQILHMGASFTVYVAVPLHVALWFRRDIAAGVRSAWNRSSREDEFDDIHNRLMSAYPEVPYWWYGITLVTSFVLACISVTAFPTGMPIWGIVVAILFTVLLQVPIGMLAAISNVQISTSILALLIGGFALEGKVIPNMIFKMFSFMSTSQSLHFVADLKLAHYAKIPPRWAFAAQIYATLLSGFIALGVNHWSLRNIEDVCAEGQPERFTCPHTHSFFVNTVLWGAIGPRRLFGPEGPYRALLYVLPLGIVLPIISYVASRRWPNSWWRHVNVPIFIAGPVGWAPFNWSYMQGTVLLAIVFNYFVKRRYEAWWTKYAYVLTASFSAATGVAAFVIFFALQRWDIKLDWIGNTIAGAGVDQGGFMSNGTKVQCVNLPLAPEQTFASGF